MSHVVVLGTQWGDEGKGRVVDLLAKDSNFVARYNGGDNAGHTVTVGEKIYKLHVITSGILHPHTCGVIGNGMVLNPQTLIEEMRGLKNAGLTIGPDRLWISDAAQLITPAHRLLDSAQDTALGNSQIGTTGRGIGPAYVDKASRRGLRAGEALDDSAFSERVERHFETANQMLVDLYHQPAMEVAPLIHDFIASTTRLKPFIHRIGPLVQAALDAGKIVLAEGAQGTLLDVEQGTYPYVTSSCTTSTGVFSGMGIGVQPVRRVIGVTKAFQTRVGAGPFPTELYGDEANFLRGSGSNPWDEYGTTTGRPRRVGWLDLVLLRYAHEINRFTELFITKLDILSGLKAIPVCVAYNHRGTEMRSLDFSGDARLMAECQPVYQTLSGWQEPLGACRRWKDLPAAARKYVEFIEQTVGLPAKNISVGSERSALITRE